MKKRKICFSITSKIHYSRNKLIIDALRDHPDVDLHLIVGGSAILIDYGDIEEQLKKDGYTPSARILMTLAGGSTTAMAKTTGLGVVEFATAYERINPDIVIVRGDRYEVMAPAIAASYLNIPIAHIEGGDVTGTIDESVRHAVTKLSHIHFTTNDDAYKRVIHMGEPKDYVFNFGSPDIEAISYYNHRLSDFDFVNALGVGAPIEFSKPYIMVMQHPVTSEVRENRKHTEETLKAVHALGMQTLWFWPNVDAGSDEVSKAIRVYREHNDVDFIRFLKYVTPEEFITLLKNTTCLVGNSSSGIKEAGYIGVPVVNIGTRQNKRMRGENVITVDHDNDAISDAIRTQLTRGRYSPSHIYYKKDTAKNIVNILMSIDLYSQKEFFDPTDISLKSERHGEKHLSIKEGIIKEIKL